MRKYKALYKFGRSGTKWMVVEAQNSMQAQEIMDAQYGASNRQSGVVTA